MSRDDAPPSSVSFLERYRSGALDEFFDIAPGDLEAALRQPRAQDRRALAGVLRQHARRLAAPPAVFDALERLEHPESRVVVAGQQTGLLLGPGYTLSKAVTAIRLAAELDTEDRPVLPLFWLASQDHDTQEIDHAYLLDHEETLHRIHVALPAERPSGRARMEAAWLDAVTQGLDALRPPPPHREEVERLVLDSAELAETYADWFAAQLYRLLGDAGLLLFDPMQPDAAALLSPVLERELASPGASVEEVRSAARHLRDLGVDPQLGRGTHATNLFLEGPGGQRVLLRHEGRDFRLEGVRLGIDEVRARLRDDPACLTPAAALRPVAQDAALPTAAVVLGPGELRYYAQLRGIYRRHGVAMPLVWPRAEATVLEPPVRRILKRYGIDFRAYQADPEGCLEGVLLERGGHAQRFREAGDELDRLMDTLLEEVAGVDPTLQGTVERGRHHLELTLRKLRGKTGEALVRNDAITRRQFRRLSAHLLPLGQPAERVLSPYGPMLGFGIAPVMRAYLELPADGVHGIVL